jgi:hypothetical protein
MSETAEYERLPRDELDRMLAAFDREEVGLSARRARLHDRIDFARQTAANDTIAAGRLEKLLADERLLAEERRALHARIDALKAARRLAA